MILTVAVKLRAVILDIGKQLLQAVEIFQQKVKKSVVIFYDVINSLHPPSQKNVNFHLAEIACFST